MGKKQEIITAIFKKLQKANPTGKILHFDNDMVKLYSGGMFKNQFDATKFDTDEKLPEALREAGFYIIHIGGGNHAFVKGVGFHDFEKPKEVKKIKIKQSVVESLGKSEAKAVSAIYNEKILHDFLYGDPKKDIKIHVSRRTKFQYDLEVHGQILQLRNLQIELDGIFETDNEIIVVEGKNVEHKNFEIRQLFSAFKYFEHFQKQGKIPKKYKIRLVFSIRIEQGHNYFKLYEYKFVDPNDPNSIKLVKCKQYDIQ